MVKSRLHLTILNDHVHKCVYRCTDIYFSDFYQLVTNSKVDVCSDCGFCRLFHVAKNKHLPDTRSIFLFAIYRNKNNKKLKTRSYLQVSFSEFFLRKSRWKMSSALNRSSTEKISWKIIPSQAPDHEDFTGNQPHLHKDLASQSPPRKSTTNWAGVCVSFVLRHSLAKTTPSSTYKDPRASKKEPTRLS